MVLLTHVSKATKVCVPIYAAIPLPVLIQGNNHGCTKIFHYKYAHHSSVYDCEMSNNTGLVK